MSNIKSFGDFNGSVNEAARGWDSMDDPHMSAQLRKVMKAAKNRPAPFTVVAISPQGKVVAQDIDIKTWELIPAAFRLMYKAHPGAKIHVEDSEGQMVKESAEMLPSFEVIAGLATVLGALDLAQAAKGGDSIIVDVAKALKAHIGDKLEATGAEAKKVIDKFKGDTKVKNIIMDAEEEIKESVNEATETGLMVVPRTNLDANKIQKWVDKSGMYGEWDAREGYFLFPEEEDGFDELEMELTKELDKLGVNYRIEGVFESSSQPSTRIMLFEEYFSLHEREYDTAEREKMANSGEALPDGSYPIADEEDLKNAIKAYGRAKDQSAAAKHIAKRAKALGLADLIPTSSDFQKSLKA